MILLKLLLLTQFLGPSGGTDEVPWYSGAGIVSSAVLNAPFNTPGAYSSPASIPLGGPVTDTRASTATYLTSSTMATATANQLRVQFNGALLEPAATNYALQSVDLKNAVWLDDGAQTTTANTCLGPTGATDMAMVDSTGSAGLSNSRYQALIVPSGTSFSGSAWFTPQSGSHVGTVFINNLTGGVPTTCACSVQCLSGGAPACSTFTASNSCFAYAAFTSLCRLTVMDGATTATASVNFGAGGGQYSVSKDLICIGYAQGETTPFSTSTIVTAGTAATRATETATVPAVGVVGAATGSGVWQEFPEWSYLIAGADRVFLSTTGLVVKWINSSQTVSITAGGATATSLAQTWTAFSQHQIRYRYGGGTGNGACIQVDAQAEVCSGTFSAITPTNPLYIEGDASGGAGGSMSGLKICPANSACN